MNASEINIFFSSVVNKMYDFTNESSEKIYRKGWFNNNTLCIKHLVNMPKVQFLVFVKFRNAIYSKQSIIIQNTLNSKDVKFFLDNENAGNLILIILENVILDNNTVAFSQLIKISSIQKLIQINLFHIINCIKSRDVYLKLEIINAIISNQCILKNHKVSYYLCEIMNLLALQSTNILSKKILIDIIKKFDLNVNDLLVNFIDKHAYNLLYLLLEVSCNVIDMYTILKYCAKVKCSQIFKYNIYNCNYSLTKSHFNNLFSVAMRNKDDNFMACLLYFYFLKKYETEMQGVLLEKIDLAIVNNYPELTLKCLSLMRFNGIAMDNASFNNLIFKALRMSNYDVIYVLFNVMDANIFINNFDCYLQLIYNSDNFPKMANPFFFKIFELEQKYITKFLDLFLTLERKTPVIIENLNDIIKSLIHSRDIDNFKKLMSRVEFTQYIHKNYYNILETQIKMQNPSTELLKIFIENQEFKKYLDVFEFIPIFCRDSTNKDFDDAQELCKSFYYLLDINRDENLKHDLMKVMFGNEIIKSKILEYGINEIFFYQKYLYYKIIADNNNILNILKIYDICGIDLHNEIKCVAIKNISWRRNRKLIENIYFKNKTDLFDYAIKNEEKIIIEKIIHYDHEILKVITIDGIIPLFDIFINEREEDKLCIILEKMKNKAIPIKIYANILNKSCKFGLCKLTEDLLELPGVKDYAIFNHDTMFELYLYIREAILEYYRILFTNDLKLIKLFDKIQQKISNLGSNDLNTLKTIFAISENVKKDIGDIISQNIIYELNEFNIKHYFNIDILDGLKYFYIIYAARCGIDMTNKNINLEVHNSPQLGMRNIT